MLAAGPRAALCIPLFVASGAGWAQTGGSIAVLSDYLYRGVSLSDERPTASLSIAHDDPQGWFVGASLTGVVLGPYRRRQLQGLGYAGYAGRLSDRLGWEAGVTGVHFGADSRYDYGEGFAGLSGEHWNMRLHYAPDDFGSGLRTAYGEFNVGLPLSPMTRATAHAGALVRAGSAPAEGGRTTLDGSVGLAVARDAWEVRLDWIVGGRSAVYPAAYARPASGTLVLSGSLAF